MLKKQSKKNGGRSSRMGLRFHKEIEKIKDSRLRNGNSKERVSTEKLTNLIVRHVHWAEIRQHITEISEEEVDNYGL